jgi:hypothetical protein
MEILDSMNIFTPEKCQKSNKNAQNGGIGGVGKQTSRII